MKIARRKTDLRASLAGPRAEGASIGLVPTMGAFHEGHLSLMRAARQECDLVVVSLFVNPRQFGEGGDLARYPGNRDEDGAAARAHSVDILYSPHVDEVYPDGFATTVAVGGLTEVLCGDEARRGSRHFDAVTTIVAKLFNSVQPDRAYFGQKDAQQAVAISRMVTDLDFPIELRILPTIREPDGLAMSSRNAYLSAADRARATGLARALGAARAEAARGERALDRILAAARTELSRSGIEPEYLEARDARDLSRADSLNGQPVLVALAAQIGGARLIDNIVIDPMEGRTG